MASYSPMQHKANRRKRAQTQSAGFLQSDSAGFRLITGLLKQKEKTEITAHLLLSFRPAASLFFVFFPVYSHVKSMCEPSLVLHSQSPFFSLSVTFTVRGHLLQNGLRLVLSQIQIMLFTSCCEFTLETGTHYMDSWGADAEFSHSFSTLLSSPAFTHSKIFFRRKQTKESPNG